MNGKPDFKISSDFPVLKRYQNVNINKTLTLQDNNNDSIMQVCNRYAFIFACSIFHRH